MYVMAIGPAGEHGGEGSDGGMELGTRHGILRADERFNRFRQVGVRAGMPLLSVLLASRQLPPEPWDVLWPNSFPSTQDTEPGMFITRQDA